MSEFRNVRVTQDPGLLCGSVWVPAGKVVTLPKERADVLLREKHAEAADSADVDFPDINPALSEKALSEAEAAELKRLQQPASELIDFPGYQTLNAKGYTTVDGVKTFIADNPLNWAEQLELDAATSKALADKLQGEEKKAPKAKAK